MENISYTLLPDPRQYGHAQQLCQIVAEKLTAVGLPWIAVATREDAADRIFIVTMYAEPVGSFISLYEPVTGQQKEKLKQAGFRYLREHGGTRQGYANPHLEFANGSNIVEIMYA